MGDPNAEEAVLLIHGFGANTNHWRFNQPVLAELMPTYAIDLLGFGRSDQPRARLKDESVSAAVSYTHLRAHETKANLVCRLLLEKKKKRPRY